MTQISPAKTDSADPLAFLETPQEAGRHGLVIARPEGSAGSSQIRRCTGQGKQWFGNSAAPGRSGPGCSEQDAERGALSQSWPAAYVPVFALKSAGLSAASTKPNEPSSGDMVVVGFPRGDQPGLCTAGFHFREGVCAVPQRNRLVWGGRERWVGLGGAFLVVSGCRELDTAGEPREP